MPYKATFTARQIGDKEFWQENATVQSSTLVKATLEVQGIINKFNNSLKPGEEKRELGEVLKLEEIIDDTPFITWLRELKYITNMLSDGEFFVDEDIARNRFIRGQSPEDAAEDMMED